MYQTTAFVFMIENRTNLYESIKEDKAREECAGKKEFRNTINPQISTQSIHAIFQ